jgi:hypothetical protein
MLAFLFNTFIGFYGFDYLQTIIKLLKEKPMEDYFLSIIHSLFLGLISVFYLLEIIDNEAWDLMSGISLGYVLFESKRCLNEHDYVMILHHFIMCLSLLAPYIIYFGFLYIPKIQYILARIFICEISNVFLWSAALMYKYKKTDNIIFKSFSLISLVSYFILRVVNFTNMLIYLYNNNIMISFYSMIPVLMMNCHWFYLLAKRTI